MGFSLQQPCIAVSALHNEQIEQAIQLAQKLHLPFINHIDNHPYDFLLIYTAKHLELRSCAKDAPGPVHVDFLQGKVAYRIKHRQGRELLTRALGKNQQGNTTVIDATAGFGTDAFTMASLGYSVKMLERSPVIAALVQDALQRVAVIDTSINLDLIVVDAKDYLRTLDESQKPDVIYLDPMYPTRQKSALVKKELRMIRAIVGDDSDAEELLAVALCVARKRVVVKRPYLAEPLQGPAPSFVIKGVTSRFDVYQTTL